MTKVRPEKDDRGWDSGPDRRTDSGLQTRVPTSSAIAEVVFGLRLDLALVCDAGPNGSRIPKAAWLGCF